MASGRFGLIVPLRRSVDHRFDVCGRPTMHGDAAYDRLRLPSSVSGPARPPATRLVYHRGLLAPRARAAPPPRAQVTSGVR